MWHHVNGILEAACVKMSKLRSQHCLFRHIRIKKYESLDLTKINSARRVHIHQGFVMMSGGAGTLLYFMKNATLASSRPCMAVTLAVMELLQGSHRTPETTPTTLKN